MPRPLMLLVFIHKDLSDYKTGELFENHFNWLSDEFEALSGRPFAIIFIPPSDAPTLSDHSYKIGIPEQALYDWYLKVEEQKMTYTSGSYDDHTRKFLLLTRDNLNSSTTGIASPKGYCAISSIRSNQSPAHEVGHMFGATHEDYEVYYNAGGTKPSWRRVQVFPRSEEMPSASATKTGKTFVIISKSTLETL
ncbi:hypothetical protein [Pseudomonas sp. BF-R-19]|uniref:hypothetical protein n=1 Tax=Pseudomonas sp. BF-R-19 TaxID=2832397 RepID=UPI001CBB6B97|nr:hypothetical protein [Pseudomonas sp. BF-R-19]